MEPSDLALWRRAREIFDTIADLDDDARAARLDEECGGDPVLRREVDSLLFHDRAADDPIAHAVGEAARAATDDAADARAGQSLLHYTIIERIGEGGMGVVWKAADRNLGRDVAIKVLPTGVGNDPRRMARFEREAKLLASLNHTNIAGVFGLYSAGEVRFLAMEYVPGEDLAERLIRGPVPVDEAVRIARQLAEALEEAHECGIVHRDLKPANIKVTPSGKVKVLDFGLAKAFGGDLLGDAATSSDVALGEHDTHEGVIMGTAAYMSPEQARGVTVDKRTDIWAFGAVLFEMLTGTRPFPSGSVAEQLAAVLTAEPDWTRLPVSMPAGLERLVRRCLQKDARQRLRDIGDARIELEQLVHEYANLPGGPILAPTAAAVGAHAARTRAQPGATSASARRRWIAAGLAVIALALAIPVATMWRMRSNAGTAAERLTAPTIAVLPLVDLSPAQDQEYFADGLTEELLNVLARNPRLRVTGRTSAFQFKNKHEDLRAIGRTLNVATLLEGSVRRTGRRVRITAQLVNAADGFQLWSESYDRDVDDVVSVRDAIARSVAEALQVTLLKTDAGSGPPPDASAPAYDAYLRGRYFLQLNTRESLERAVDHLSEAVSLDPGFARAWAQLSMVHSRRAAEGYTQVKDGYEQARRAANRALAIDPNSADAHSALAVVRRIYDWNWEGADASSRRALQLDPGNAALILDAARVASALGRMDQAIELARRAATTDPLNVTVHYRLGRYAYFTGRFDEATSAFRQVLTLNPDYPGARADLGMVFLGQSRPDAALAEVNQEKRQMWKLHALAMLYHYVGRRADADAALAAYIEEFQDLAAYQVAQIYAFRREPERTLAWLERAYTQRDSGLSQLKSDPNIGKALANDQRFIAFLAKMGLPR